MALPHSGTNVRDLRSMSAGTFLGGIGRDGGGEEEGGRLRGCEVGAYPMSGTEIGYAARFKYAMSGTALGCAAIVVHAVSVIRDVRYVVRDVRYAAAGMVRAVWY
eukprot:3235006-Rhodomonas_salina.2